MKLELSGTVLQLIITRLKLSDLQEVSNYRQSMIITSETRRAFQTGKDHYTAVPYASRNSLNIINFYSGSL